MTTQPVGKNRAGVVVKVEIGASHIVTGEFHADSVLARPEDWTCTAARRIFSRDTGVREVDRSITGVVLAQCVVVGVFPTEHDALEHAFDLVRSGLPAMSEVALRAARAANPDICDGLGSPARWTYVLECSLRRGHDLRRCSLWTAQQEFGFEDLERLFHSLELRMKFVAATLVSVGRGKISGRMYREVLCVPATFAQERHAQVHAGLRAGKCGGTRPLGHSIRELVLPLAAQLALHVLKHPSGAGRTPAAAAVIILSLFAEVSPALGVVGRKPSGNWTHRDSPARTAGEGAISLGSR